MNYKPTLSGTPTPEELEAAEYLVSPLVENGTEHERGPLITEIALRVRKLREEWANPQAMDLLVRSFDHLGKEIARLPLNESAESGAQQLSMDIAKHLDAARVASAAEKT